MGFKTDTSFLRFLTMGALGVRQTMDQMSSLGFEPIELERYCGSNKIWATKVKRLRMADVLCVRTGLRVEIRAKSDLKIRMSDAPANPDRTWDAGLRNEDVVAFIAVHETEGGFVPAKSATFFTCGALRATASTSKLGPPKSASEGAERDRTWPSVVPSRSGVVKSVTADKLVVEMRGDGSATRMQTYSLAGKHSYVRPGDAFSAEASIIAGTPASLANLHEYRKHAYDPLQGLASQNSVDRYAAAKAIPHRIELKTKAVPALEALMTKEPDERVALEAAGSAAAMGSELGQMRINALLAGDGRADLRMEAVLILTELGNSFAREELLRVASDQRFAGDEIRQAAVWGLGKSGMRSYGDLVPFISDSDENVAMHAIVAFGSDAPENVIEKLVRELADTDARKAAAASEALRVIASTTVVQELAGAVESGRDWVIATLGRLPPEIVNSSIQSKVILAQIAPLQLLNERMNWLKAEARTMDLAFLLKQSV